MKRRRRLAGLVLVSVGSLVVGVIEPAVAASSGPASAPRIDPGTAAATADVLGVSPAVSGLQLSATIGESSAAFQHTETQAKSGTLDLGSLGLVLATSQFCGRPELPSSAQPQPLTAASQDGKQHLTHGAGGFGQESVSVNPSPESATATTTTIDQKLPGVLSVRGRSRANVHYIDGHRQVATSSVIENVSLLGGQVRFEGMSWKATRTSGVTSTRATHFSFGRVSVGGVPLSAPDSAPDATIAAINTALASAGLSVIQPVHTANRHTGAVAIGPFTVRFRGSRIERALVNPVGVGVVALENLMTTLGSPGDNCANVRELIDNVDNNAGTLLHVALAIAEGAGALDVQLGGVAAATQNPVSFTDPFGGTGAPPVVRPSSPSAPVSPAHGTAGPEGPAGQAVTMTGAAPVTTAPVLAADTHCISTSPSRAHGCWRGLATVASTGALALGVILLIGDVALTRRRRHNSRGADASE